MHRLVEKLGVPAAAHDSLTLPFDARTKSRRRVVLDSGAAAALFLPRGTILRDGDCLRGEGGIVVTVRAAAEDVSTVTAGDPFLLARVCYHLGNRHVPLQIERDWLRYQHDHVLDEMVRGLGAAVRGEREPFEPEVGAYHHGHSHARGSHGE